MGCRPVSASLAKYVFDFPLGLVPANVSGPHQIGLYPQDQVGLTLRSLHCLIWTIGLFIVLIRFGQSLGCRAGDCHPKESMS